MKIHRHLPILKNIYASRDQALRRLSVATALRAETLAELEATKVARDNAIRECDRALAGQAAVMGEAALLREKLQMARHQSAQHQEGDHLKYLAKPFIVVMAVGRSGSTLLQGVLNAMPGLLIRGENGGFLLELSRSYDAVCFARKHAASFTTPENPWFGCEELDPDALLTDLARVTVGQLLGSRVRQDHRAIGSKEIRWLQDELGGTTLWNYLDFVQRMFADTRFVLLTRDTDELLQSGWWPMTATSATRRAIEQFYALARTGNFRSLFEIDYRDLHPDSEAVRRLADFVGSQYTPEVDRVFASRHSYDSSDSKLREQDIARLRAMLDADVTSPLSP